MKVANLKPGRYVVAVSGGVDSMVLLDLLAKNKNLGLIVAHFNHGIRDDSDEDEKLVKEASINYGLSFRVGHGNLGKKANEAAARTARYKFLNDMAKQQKANAIITAHHQDDMIETAFINILRGTGPKGLVAIKKNTAVIRPLLPFTKKQILKYASDKKLKWREDVTNTDEKYLRNYLRNNVVSKMTPSQRLAMLKNIDKVAKIEEPKHKLIAILSHSLINNQRDLSRAKFNILPNDLGNEILTYWLNNNGMHDYDRRIIHQLNNRIRTGAPDTETPIVKGYTIELTKTTAKLKTTA